MVHRLESMIVVAINTIYQLLDCWNSRLFTIFASSKKSVDEFVNCDTILSLEF